ncbi:M28 family peptidase [Candidatus Binatia bacterium]|nr:M28 family peptidase [Candidatus Binatia bacterium]
MRVIPDRFVDCVLCAALLVGQCAAAQAVDVGMPGGVTVVKLGNVTRFVAKSASGFPLPAPGSAEDPTTGGAELRFFDTALGGATRATFELDASGWKGLGRPAGSKGYRYKGRDDATGGACTSVVIKEKTIKAVCKGTPVTLSPPFASTEGIVLGLPAGTAALRYCAEFGGEEKKNDAVQMRRTTAPAPAVCPEPPVGGLDPNDVLALSADALQGRNNNTAGSVAAQQILIDALREFAVGLNYSQTGDDAFKQPFVQGGQVGTNVVAVIPGSDLANEYVVVGGHYDHVGACTSLVAGDVVCNGATDNAAGAAAVLTVGRAIAALPVPPRRSVVLALWDAEEDGLLGSLYYANNPLVPLMQTVAYVNFDIQGANLLPSLKRYTFAVGPETGGTAMGTLLGQAASGTNLDLRSLSYIFGQGRSDFVNFVNSGVPTVFFTDSTGPCYHTSGDDASVVDFGKLEKQTRVAYELALALANAASPPAFVAPSPALATYADAVAIDELLTAALADLSMFSAADQLLLTGAQVEIAAIVAAGPGNFDSADVLTLLLDTLDLVDALTRTECDGFR